MRIIFSWAAFLDLSVFFLGGGEFRRLGYMAYDLMG